MKYSEVSQTRKINYFFINNLFKVIEKIRSIGSGLIFKGIESSNSSNIGIYSSNRNEWIISEHACYSFSFPVVSLYDSYGKDSIRYILNHGKTNE